MVWREVKNKRVKEELQHLHRGEQPTSEGDTVSQVRKGLLIRRYCVFVISSNVYIDLDALTTSSFPVHHV